MYAENEVRDATMEYFNGDELATNVWMTKYALKDKKGEYQELTPDDMHRRIAKEFARIEKKFNAGHEIGEEKIFNYLRNFDYIVPQGSPMMGLVMTLLTYRCPTALLLNLQKIISPLF